MACGRRMLSTVATAHSAASGTFTRRPLNYETFHTRLRTFRKLNKDTQHTPQAHILADCIVAARILERQRISQYSGTRTPHRPAHSDFLGIRRSDSYTSLDLERTVVSTLKEYEILVSQNHQIVKTYLLTEPTPTDPNEIIKWARNLLLNSINRKEKPTFARARAIDVVKIALRLLLNDKDYENAFKLLDMTISSFEYIEYQNKVYARNAGTYASITAILGALVICQYLVFVGLLGMMVSLMLPVSFLNLHALKCQLNRVGWRPHRGTYDKLLCNTELFMVNKIITHYEEHLEVNVRNFHHSEVRTKPNLNMFDRNDYVLEVPDANLKSEDAMSHTLSPMERMFRAQLKKRKMVLHDLDEELMFLDFWLVQGENYEWVEPDQDPAEIIKLRTQLYRQNRKNSDETT